MMMSFFDEVLKKCLRQNATELQWDMQPRVQSSVLKTPIGESSRNRKDVQATIKAADDGGISYLRYNGTDWVTNNPYLALFEAKKAFDDFEGTPIMSNKNLAQYLGEAIVTWKENPHLVGNGYVRLSSTSCFQPDPPSNLLHLCIPVTHFTN